MIRVQDSLKLSTRMFKTRPARTWLTIFGIGVGIAAVVVLVGLGYGLQGVLLEKIVFGEALLSLNVGTPPSKVVVIDDLMLEEFSALDNIDAVEPMASFTSLITLGDLTGSVMLQGARPAYFNYAGVMAAEGELYVEGDKDKIAISAAVLKLFEIDPLDALGQRVRFKVFIAKLDSEDVVEVPLSREYVISAVIDDQASLFAYIPLTEFE